MPYPTTGPRWRLYGWQLPNRSGVEYDRQRCGPCVGQTAVQSQVGKCRLSWPSGVGRPAANLGREKRSGGMVEILLSAGRRERPMAIT
jgi:hypothetical protein